MRPTRVVKSELAGLPAHSSALWARLAQGSLH